jgi:hypothetical protein
MLSARIDKAGWLHRESVASARAREEANKDAQNGGSSSGCGSTLSLFSVCEVPFAI